jgi:hypothetical protein
MEFLLADSDEKYLMLLKAYRFEQVAFNIEPMAYLP